MGVGNSHLGLGNPGEAIAAYRKGLDLKPTDASAHYVLAKLYLSQSETVLAIEHLREARKHAKNPALLKEIESLLVEVAK